MEAISLIRPLFINDDIANKKGEISLDYSSVGSFWVSLNQNVQPFYFYLVYYCVVSSIYLGIGGLFYIIEQNGWLLDRKINKERKTAVDYVNCLKNLGLNMCVVIPISLLLGWPFLTKYIVNVHAPLEEFPTLFTVIIQIIIALYIEDLAHYILHRILHIPVLYKRIHKKHHEFQVTFALAGNYADPMETGILSICTFLPLVILRMHLFTFYLWILTRWVDAAIEHCGYDIVPHVLPFQGGVSFHDYHHAKFVYNFGSRFTYLDKLFGTYAERSPSSSPSEYLPRAPPAPPSAKDKNN